MIDTVILTFSYGKFEIIDHSKFMPNTSNFVYGAYDRAVNNPRKEESRCSYYQRITLYKRPSKLGQQIELKIEFSVPKILYNNNLDEVVEDDFDRILELLQSKLFFRGVSISIKNLKNAIVSGFHPSKNIQLFGFYTSTFIIKELAKISLTKRMDLTKTTFANDGESLQCYANSHSFVFYDKISDMNKAKGRAIDKEKTGLQLTLFKSIQEMRKYDSIEILKMEVRLSKKRKMNQVLEKLGYAKNPIFQDIFKKEVCQRILKDYWKNIVEEKNSFLFQEDEKDVSKELDKIFETKKKPKEALFYFGLSHYIKQKSVIELRNKIEEVAGKNGWARFPAYLKELNKMAKKQGGNKLAYVQDIERALDSLEPIRTKNLTDPMTYLDNLRCNGL